MHRIPKIPNKVLDILSWCLIIGTVLFLSIPYLVFFLLGIVGVRIDPNLYLSIFLFGIVLCLLFFLCESIRAERYQAEHQDEIPQRKF